MRQALIQFSKLKSHSFAVITLQYIARAPKATQQDVVHENVLTLSGNCLLVGAASARVKHTHKHTHTVNGDIIIYTVVPCSNATVARQLIVTTTRPDCNPKAARYVPVYTQLIDTRRDRRIKDWCYGSRRKPQNTMITYFVLHGALFTSGKQSRIKTLGGPEASFNWRPPPMVARRKFSRGGGVKLPNT